MKTATRRGAESSVREKLLRVARDLFTTRGYTATSVREIVEAAGVTKPALYYHFASKEGIYLAILDDLRSLFDTGIAEHGGKAGNVRCQIEEFILGLYDLFEQNRAAARFLNAAFWGPTQSAPSFDFQALNERFISFVALKVEEGISAGEIRGANTRDVSLTLLGALSSYVNLTLAHPRLSSGKTGLRRILALIFTGVAAHAPTRRETAR